MVKGVTKRSQIKAHGVMQSSIDKTDMCRVVPYWAAVFCHRVAQSQSR